MSWPRLLFDRFGLDADVSDIKDGSFTVSANVRISQGFISWLSIFGDKAKVLAPQNLCSDIRAFIDALHRAYC